MADWPTGPSATWPVGPHKNKNLGPPQHLKKTYANYIILLWTLMNIKLLNAIIVQLNMLSTPLPIVLIKSRYIFGGPYCVKDGLLYIKTYIYI